MKHKRKQFDQLARHEVYDRASIVLELFCEYVQEHPVVAADKALSAEADKVSDAIYQFYNTAATKLMAPQTHKMDPTEYRNAQKELRDLEQRLERLQRTHPAGSKGLTRAGIRKMIARLHEELASYEGSEVAIQSDSK